MNIKKSRNGFKQVIAKILKKVYNVDFLEPRLSAIGIYFESVDSNVRISFENIGSSFKIVIHNGKKTFYDFIFDVAKEISIKDIIKTLRKGL